MTADEAKNAMIQNQLEGRGMVDQDVLGAFRAVDRLLFVPEGLARLAYADEPLPIGYGQTISQPFVVAIMTELLGLDKTARVLEVGTGSGYQTAILSRLAREVVTIERIKELHESAKKLLDVLGYGNVRAVLGDGYEGYPEAAPYDGIVVTAAPPTIPEALVAQLAPGGRMIAPIGTGEQMLVRITKNKRGELTSENIFPVLFVPMRHG
jgi:protein-L-isoaspartate(D-aspartate) O-methyltransferase